VQECDDFSGREGTVAFPIPLASKMSGASVSQLRYWHREGILVPEVEHSSSPYLYSFRDVVALRTFAWLRGDHSLQQIRKSLDIVRDLDAVQHPSEYVLVKLGKSIGFKRLDGAMIDVGKEPGQELVLGTLADVFAQFETHGKRRVDPLVHPRPQVEVNPDRLGGWPTIKGTRIPYDTIALLIEDGTVSPGEAGDYYPGVTADAARDALDYFQSVAGAA
jgi:uncharacterized protein (DUF433 family)/DNA-binding transcriptional MerR regulator